MNGSSSRLRSVGGFLVLLGAMRSAPAADVPALIPAPREITPSRETGLVLTDGLRIVATDWDLLPLARVLAEELKTLTGFTLDASVGRPKPGAIVLELSEDLGSRDHVVDVGDDRARILGSSTSTVADGTVVLLQSIRIDPDRPSPIFPRLSLRDTTAVPYCGLVIDTTTHRPSIETLEQWVILCRFYRIRYLQLRLADDDAFLFPSAALANRSDPTSAYPIDQLRALVRFAIIRGVVIVPEIGGPAPPAETAEAALATLIGELCDVFITTPYIHCGHYGDHYSDPGGDAAQGAGAPTLSRLDELVRKRGKEMILWDDGSRTASDATAFPPKLVIMARTARPGDQGLEALLQSGRSVINASERPLGPTRELPWTDEDIFAWNIRRWQSTAPGPSGSARWDVKPPASILGAVMDASRIDPAAAWPLLRNRLPAFAERVHQTDAPTGALDLAELRARRSETDRRLQLLLYGLSIQTTGDPAGPSRAGDRSSRELTLTLSLARGCAEIRYTLDGSEPTRDAASPYKRPLTLNATTTLRARAFDAEGNAIGYERRERFDVTP